MRTQIQAILPPGTERVETGALEINKDWAGLFMRGDHAIGLRLAIRQAMPILEEQMKVGQGANLFSLLSYLKEIESIVDEDVTG